MEAESPAPAVRKGRPRAWLLVLLVIVAVAFFLTRTPGPVRRGGVTTAPGAPQAAGAAATIDPGLLDVHLESLALERPVPASTGRNPFRFHARPAEAPPQAYPAPEQELGPRGNLLPPAPRPPASPPITVKFIGVLERAGETFAIFVDCTAGRRTPYAREGEIVDGRYRLVTIGRESVVIEHLDGTGRMTLAQNGQECVR